jgi:hypothetical protein
MVMHADLLKVSHLVTDNLTPAVVQLHLVTGRKHLFYQEDKDLVQRICGDLDGLIFSRASLVVDSIDGVTAFPGHSLLGISVLTEPIPSSFLARESLSRTIITQISQEDFEERRLLAKPRREGERMVVLSELEFVSGEHLYLEFSEIALSALGERNALHHLFSNPLLSCRRLEGGFSIWNTAHIVSWSHYPKQEVPTNAWLGELLEGPIQTATEVVSL